MKTLLYTLLIASLLGCAHTDDLKTATFSFLIDRTEDSITAPTGSYILSRLPSRSPNSGLELCYTIIGSTPYTESQCFVLNKGETGMLANEDTRRKENRLLYKRFTDSVAVKNTMQFSFERSDIFRTVVVQLERLSHSEGSKELWLFSDLKEHSFFSVYDPKQHYKLLHDLESVVTTFEKETPIIGDLSGITIRVIHSPTLEDSKLFSQLVILYRKILEPKGAIIEIGVEDQIHISK